MRTFSLVAGAVLLLVSGCGSSPRTTTDGDLKGEVAATYEEASQKARTSNKPLLLVAYKGNPADVDMMLLSDPNITSRSNKVVVAKVDGNKEGATLDRLNIRQFPSVVIYRPNGTYFWGKKGANPEETARVLDQLLTGAPAQ